MALPAGRTSFRCGIAMLKLAVVISISTNWISPVLASFIRFKPDTEYVYTFHSSTELKKVRTLQAESKIGFILVTRSNGSNGLQEIYLRVHTVVVTSQEEQVRLSEERDFSDWFSFDIGENGAIGQVYFPRDQDDHVIGVKKGLASLLAANLQHPPQEKVLKSDWSYDCNETGHEGHHESSYTAQMTPGNDGIIVFTKTRRTHPIPYGRSKHQKEIHYHPAIQLPSLVKILDHFDAPTDSAPGFQSQHHGDEQEGDDMVFPEMQTVSEGQLTFVGESYYPSPTGPPGDEDIVTDSIHFRKPQDDHLNFNMTSLKEEIAGNLTCMRTAPMKGSHEQSHCFQKLVQSLHSVPDRQKLAEIVTPLYKRPLSRRVRDKQDRLNMLDAVAEMHTDESQLLLSKLILLSPKPSKELVERLLIASAGFTHTISERYLETVEDIAFQPHTFPESLQDPEIQRVAVLVLGALAGHRWKAGYKSQAEIIVGKIEDKLGVHDPWAYEKKLTSLTSAEQEEYHHNTVALIEALGNAGLRRSFPHIQSYTNHSATHPLLKRAGLHSMRDYRHDAAAGLLLKSALDENESEHVRYEASLLYKNHLMGGQENISKFVTPEEYSAVESSRDVATSAVSVPSRRRVRRGFWEGIEFKLASPSINWRKLIGSSKTGAEFGLTIKNELDLKIAPLSGHLRVDLFDEAYATVVVGLVGLSLDIARARFCFNGFIDYNLNILQEFGVERISDFVKAYDLIIGQVVGNIRRAVDIVVDLFNGDTSISQLFDNFVQALENIPSAITNVRSVATQAVSRLAQFDPDQLPSSFRGVINVVNKATQLFGDIKTDVMEFYQAVNEAITVTLPWAAEQIWKSITAIADSIADLLKSPLKAVGDIFKGVLNIKTAISEIINAKKEIEEANFLKEGQRPYWFDLPTVIGQMLTELWEHLGNIRRDLRVWVDEVASSADPVKKLTGGAADSHTLRRQVQDEIESIFQELIEPIQPIQDLLAPFFELYDLVFNTVEAVKEAYQTLKDGYQKSQALVMKLFGPKAHKSFPRKYREPGSGECASGGFYPTDSAGHYEDLGVDLEISAGTRLVAPFSGTLYRSAGKPNQVTLLAGGGAFRNIKIFIDNIEPNRTISADRGVRVIAGTVIGTVGRSSTCTPPNYIHLSMKDSKPNRLAAILNSFLDDDPSDSDLASKEGYVDPSNYLAKRPLSIPKWTQVCDDYRLVWKGKTVKEGSLLGRKKNGETNNTSPPRRSPPVTTASRPDPSRRPPKRTVPLEQAIAPGNKQQTQEALGLPEPKLGSGSPFQNFTLRNLRIGSILAFARRIGLEETADDLLTVVKTIVKLVSDKPCVLPESLSNDMLRIELQQRGLSSQGERKALLQRYKQPDDRCPLLQVSLPKNVYCKIDESCLGVECCMNLKLFMVSLAFKAFMRFDPCEFQFVIGVNSWNYTIQILDVEFGKEWDVPVPFDIPFLDNMELHLRYGIEKSRTQLLVSLSVGVCPTTGDADCLPFLQVLKDSAIPLPICHPNGTITWPEIDLEEYFSRAALKSILKNTGEELLKAGAEAALKYVLEELGIPKELLDSKEPCPTPSSLSRIQLRARLEERLLAVTGTRMEMEARLSQDDRTCEFFTLPAFSPELAKVAYCSLSQNCLRLDCCLQLNLEQLKFRRSFKAFVEVDACDFTFRVAFQHLQYRKLLLSYEWGQPQRQAIGPITLKYSIDKLDAEKVFEIDFGASVCESADDCVFNVDIIQDYRVPIPLCNANFSFSLPGGNSLRDFIDQVGQNAGQQAINIFLEFIGIRDKITDGPCDTTALIRPDEEACTDVSLPPLARGVTCELSARCLGIRCCTELDLEITVLSVNMWLVLDPCELTLSMGFGNWSLTFTIFDYHWGTQEELKIGKALTLIYTIDKLTADRVFVLDLALSLCLPDSDCNTPSIDLLKETRVPIPLCNENFTLTLPGDGTVKGFLQMVGQNAADPAIDFILAHLGLSEFISRIPCVRPQVTQNGWHRICPRDIRLPHLPRNLICTLPEKCLGFDCCLELPIPGIRPISTQVSLTFDPCHYGLSVRLGSWSLDLQILSYRWGQREEVNIGNAVTISLTIDKLDAQESFQLNLDISICIDADCTTTPVLQDSLVPIPFCNLNASFALPGDGSFAGLARELSGNVGELAIQAGLRKLGIQQYVGSQQCDMEILAPNENNCPVLRLPPPSSLLTCRVEEGCLGLTCCASLDLVFTQISTTAYAILDPCEFQLSVGLGSWAKNLTLFEYDWGVNKALDISDSVRIEYNVDKLSEEKEFLIDLSVALCIDGTCRPIHLLQAARVPIPLCNPNATLSLPGDGTISGYLDDLAGHVTDEAVDLVLDYLGLKNFLSGDTCSIPPAPPVGSDSCPVQIPDSLPSLSCQISGRCTSLRCCLNLDLKVTQLSARAWLIIDPCEFTLSVGLELWYFNASLFSYNWGTMESFKIGDALDVKFSIDKLDASQEYQVDLAFALLVDGVTTGFPIMSGQRVPIPLCNANFSLALPGDGSVRGFLTELGDNVGQAAVQLVLGKLNLQNVIIGAACQLPSDLMTATHCPSISLPFLENVVQCAIDDRCLGIQCCVYLDFVVAELTLSARLQVDPCDFRLYVAFENWEQNITLFRYTWGEVETINIGNAVTLSFSIEKLTAKRVFSVTLGLTLCIDDVCTMSTVLDHVWVPIPLCNTNASAFALPGDGTVEGFIRELGGHIGSSAIDLVLEKFGLSQYLQSEPCDRGTPGTLRSGCPAIDVTQLPDFLSCTVTDSCLGVRCCLEMDLTITTRSVSAWFILDPCNFTLSLGFEQWDQSVTLFRYPLGDAMEEVVNSVLRVRWRVAKVTEDKQFEIDLSLVLCLDGSCDTLTVFAGSRLPIPLCNAQDSFTLPGDGTVSGFLSYLGGNVGQFAVDAALRHLNLTGFLTGKACSYHSQDVCASSTGILGNCSVIGETCTELRCCLELDLKIADVSATAWARVDPCDFTFSLGLETWVFHGSVFNYEWGKQTTVTIAPGMNLRYSINKQNDTQEFAINMGLEYCIDGLCTEVGLQHNIPIPVCNPGFSNYSLSVDGFLETVSGQVIQGASLALLARLGIDPDFFSSQPCLNSTASQSYRNCPDLQLPGDLTSLAHCGILNTCFGVRCCLDVNLGPLHHTFGASMVVDPCRGRLTLQFGNWEYSKSLSTLDFATSREITIGNFVLLRYTLQLMAGEISMSLSIDACIDGDCTGQLMILDGAVSPLPRCYPNGTVSWNNLPGLNSISQLASLDAGFEAVAEALGLPSRLVSASPCPPVILPGQSGVCSHLPSLPTLSSGGVCHYSETCLGVECCLAVDLGIISRTLRSWLIVDPCDFTLSAGFENWSYNVTLLSYKWGHVTRERLSDAVLLTFTVDKTADNRNVVLSLSLQLCIVGVCAPDIVVLEDLTAPIPFCNPNGSLEWAQDLGDIGDYASGLVVNRLSVSADVLLPQSCSGPPQQITPTTTGCSLLALPSSVAPLCSLDQSCLGVGCCLNFDLGVVQRSFSVWVKLDPCIGTFSFGFEKWSHVETIGIQLLQTHSFEKSLGVLKIRYDVERPHSTAYDVDLDISLCWQGVCEEPVVILRDAMFSGCAEQGGGSSARRRRRSLDDLESAEDMDSMADLTANPIDMARAYFKTILSEGSTSYSAEENALTKLQPEKAVKPRIATSGTASRRSMGLLVFGDEDETPVTRRKRRDLSVSVNAGGASLFGLSLNPGSDSGTWQGDVIIGGGLTQKGLDALGQRIANMTIGELEAMLDLQNIDPFTVVQLMKDLRALFRTFIEEFIDVIINGKADDKFKQFDVVLSGTIPFPRRQAKFFQARWGIPVGGFIYLEFSIEAGGFFDMEIPVSVALVSMKAKGGITPMVGAYVQAGVSIGFILYGEMHLIADVLHTSFPTVAEIGFSKFPLDVGLKMDIDMIPLVIRLKALVTLKIPFFGRKTLFKKELWRYTAPSIHKTIFDIHTKQPDTSPPETEAYSTPVDASRTARSPEGTTTCGVEQVPGLDYTEPAFQLEMVAFDDKSLVTFFYQVGTAPGASNVASKTEFGGPSAIISQTLLGGHPLYFTVYAMNNGGGTTTATCDLPTFDITLPTGRITPDFTSTSHPYILRASAVVYDDSVILTQKEGVGFGPGIWGDQIVPWNSINVTERQNLGVSINDFHYFTAAKKGRLISTPTSTVTHRNPNFCARDCLALPETKCLSINYDYRDFACELLEEIEGHGVEVHESGLFTHYERLGVGHAVEFNHESLQLVHNNLYYFNIELLNYVAYENSISSVGVLADFSPPCPGLIVNGTRDEERREACVEFTPEEWRRRCIEDTPLNNHRYITDGPGSQTVFNGYEELVDLRYTRSNTFMAANWEGIHDNETGIHGYTWSIGNAVCDDDVSSHIDPHAHLFDESEWTHQGLVVNVYLPDGAYYITVRALNKVEFGGPMALTVCHSTPLTIDNTPPIIYSIYDITYDSSVGRIGLKLNATDPQSHLLEYHLAAGRTARDTSLRDWEAYALADQLFMDFKIPNGVPCWVKVRAVNNVDLRTIDHADEPILVDDTPPIVGDLFDGPYAGKNLVFTKDRNEICGNWHNWYDPESGIFSYLWAVGTQPGLSNVVDYVQVSRRQHSACSGYVTLQHGEMYYSTLVAFHGGYDKLNVSASSDGVTVDLTPPIQGSVYDGLLPGLVDLDYSSRPATVEAQWRGFSDPESGIEDYQVTVYRKKDNSANRTDDFVVIHEAEAVGSETSFIEWHHFHLHHKDQVYVNLRTINQALNHIDTPSNGFLVDLTPPMLRTLGDGLVVGQDADFQSHADYLAVHWDYFDDESGIESFELAIYEMKEGNKHKIFPIDSNPNSFELLTDTTARSHVQSGLTLQPGALYVTRVRARNQARLVASHETSGIKVDPSPPLMRYVRGGNLDGEVEEVIDGYLYQSSRSTVQASWLAVDGQSGIKSYWVAVGTAPYFEDIQPFSSLGPTSSGLLSDLNMHLTNASTCSEAAFTVDCQPVYYVCVKSENGAGTFSDIICSSPIRVVEEDQTGYVTDGPSMVQDLGAQQETTTVSIWFDDFQSQVHGISHYEWAVGTSPGGEDIQPLTSDGIVPGSGDDVQGLAGQGKAQSPLPLRHGVTYYSTLRAITNADNVLESTSNGFTVDISPPEIRLTDLGQYDASVDLRLDGGLHLYQSNTDSMDAMWDVEDGESDILRTYFSVGRYPGGDDVFPRTATNTSYIPSTLMSPADIGVPNILSVEAVNSVGLSRTVFAISLTVDNTPPTVGQVQCPAFIHANSALLCSWTGFLDAESGIDHVVFLVGSARGRGDVFQSDDLPGYFTHYRVTANVNLIHNKVYYVTIEAFNAVNQGTMAFSGPIEIDDTPPSHGLVVELSGVYSYNFSDPIAVPEWDCTGGDEECLSLDGECLESLSQLQILWQPFTDEDTRITLYEVALGTTPGGSQLKPFYEVSKDQTSELITNIDLSSIRRVYATVRGYNEAGLASTAVSNGIYVSRFSAGLQPLRPFQVKDGVTDVDKADADFQTSLNEMSASWDFSGDPCPVRKYEWAIYRIDGQEIQPFTNVLEQTSDTNTDIEMTDGESYYSLVRATNALGLALTVRSDGITVKRDPLIPGRVYDGLLVGFDLTYQKATDTISASWKGFGEGMPARETIHHTGNTEVMRDHTTEQTVDYYEAAVGTDRRYPKTRDNVVPFTYVGQNTTVTFTNLDLMARGSTYYVTVRGHSASYATAQVTSTGINVGIDSTVIDLSSIRRVYATVRGYNEAGLASTAVSNGIYVSRFSAGLQPLRPFQVKDGVTDVDKADADFQTSLNEMSASWDFSGDPCPVRKYEWAIYRIDGQEIQPFTNVLEQTSDTNTDIEMTDGESYYSLVRATNALGLALTVRSDGITVKRDPLIPGRVYDGLLVGFDLTYQKATDTISASWKGFGEGMPARETIHHTGNTEVMRDHTTEQTVDYYEAAVGTDRRYPKTRDNVVPFTYVGQNTTVTFTNLDLMARGSTYYVTVRGHSASYATAQVTSTGINVGIDSTVIGSEVEVSEYVNSASEVQLQWAEFESTFPILLYYVGVGEPSVSSPSPDDMDCLDMLLGSQQAEAAFHERAMRFVGKDTYVQVKGLNLTQTGSYYVTVVGMNEGGQCNSSTSYFTVDITPPVEGRLRVGPFYDMPVAYTDSAESISVLWEDYRDDESGIQAYNLRLVQAASCHEADLTSVANQDWLELGPDVQDFTFVDLDLMENHPYFVQLSVVNHAGDSVLSQVGPIFVDSSEPTAGLVVDGMDFKMDITDSGDRDQVTGTILHMPNPLGPPCALRSVPFTDQRWSAVDFKGLWNMNRDKWDLEYQSQQVLASDESVVLRLERDTRGPRMLSGAYAIHAQVVRSSEYEFDLIAASPELHSVTSILFWDGPEGAVGEFDFGGPENWREGICQCCYDQPFNQSMCPQCNCLEFLGSLGSSEDNSTIASTTHGSHDTTPTSEFTVSTMTEEAEAIHVNGASVTPMVSIPWTIRQIDEDGDSVSDDESGRWISQRACGFQLYPNGSASQAVLWCRYLEDTWQRTSEVVDLDFDPSVQEHHYSINIKVMPFDANEDEWSLEVFVDSKLLVSLTGIPVLSSSTKLILNVFNQDSYVAELQDPFNPPSVTATVKNLRMPPDQSNLCRYGAPFRAGTSPVSRYFAGVGSQAGATDIVPFQEIARPCVPCMHPCDRYQCRPSCSLDAVPITFTLANVTLPRLEVLHATPDNEGNSTTPLSNLDEGSLPVFLTVSSMLGNGKSVSASSNGFYIDDTPPKLDVFFYMDVNVNQSVPTSFQSSDSAISTLWKFVDMDSMVKEHYWAIGTSKGARDLQGFVSVGLNQTATNGNLTGLLHHNTTYYVTVKAINGAGLETIVECEGVTVLLQQPSVDDVNTTSLFSQTFQEDVYPPDAEKSKDPTKTGTSWSKPQDESINHYEYCVSSTAELLDDVVACIVVGGNSSGSVTIENGMIIVAADDKEERFNITDFKAPRESSQSDVMEEPAKFNMEPGKCLYTWLKMCNPAMLCDIVSAGTTTVLGDSDMLMTSPNGTDLVLASATSQRRRKRALDNHFDFTVTTEGGLREGGSLILGLLDADRTNQEFTSDAALDYQPYITNPLYTIQYTSRLLRHRIQFVYEPTFYIASLGQTELEGPLTINVILSTPGNWTEAKPRLIYWDKGLSEWQDAAKTCSDMDQISYGNDRNEVSVQVCSTHSPALPSTEPASQDESAVSNTTYFSHETHFALAVVLDAIPNNPPVITNLVENMFMNEEEGTLSYTFQASDIEDDILVFELGSNHALQGIATISENGVFSYTPCPDCYGTVTLQITVREIQTFPEIQPLSVTVNITIEVLPVNDNPVLYSAHHGQIVGNGRIALLTVEQNTGSNVAYKDLSAVLGAYDVDTNDELTIITRPPTYGTLTLTDQVRTVPSSQNCSEPSLGGAEPVIPCGIELPHSEEDLSWTTTTFTYAPNPNFHGRDSFLVLVQDQSGAVSQLLEVEIAVLVNPCIHDALCTGPAEDPDCTSPERSSGFESYSCHCQPGWVGDICDIDYDECQSTPCEYPYVCYDQLSGYQCACPLSDPQCDDLNWRVKVIIGAISCLVGLVVTAAVVFCLYKKKHNKKSQIFPLPEPDDEQLVTSISGSTQQAFDNPLFEDDSGDQTVSYQTVDKQASHSRAHDSPTSPKASYSSGLPKNRPWSGLLRSNAVEDACPALAEATSLAGQSCDKPPSESAQVHHGNTELWAEPTMHAQSSTCIKEDDDEMDKPGQMMMVQELTKPPSAEESPDSVTELPGSLVSFTDDGQCGDTSESVV